MDYQISHLQRQKSVKQIDDFYYGLFQREIKTKHLQQNLTNHKNENIQLRHHLQHNPKIPLRPCNHGPQEPTYTTIP